MNTIAMHFIIFCNTVLYFGNNTFIVFPSIIASTAKQCRIGRMPLDVIRLSATIWNRNVLNLSSKSVDTWRYQNFSDNRFFVQNYKPWKNQHQGIRFHCREICMFLPCLLQVFPSLLQFPPNRSYNLRIDTKQSFPFQPRNNNDDFNAAYWKFYKH